MPSCPCIALGPLCEQDDSPAGHGLEAARLSLLVINFGVSHLELISTKAESIIRIK